MTSLVGGRKSVNSWIGSTRALRPDSFCIDAETPYYSRFARIGSNWLSEKPFEVEVTPAIGTRVGPGAVGLVAVKANQD